jgi:tetratricopeptide (TPR) repeat protein
MARMAWWSDESMASVVWGPAVAGALLAGAVAGALFLLPTSPLAFGRADAWLGQGHAVEAATAYLELGARAPSLDVRREALERAAAVRQLELSEPEEARRLLKLRLSLDGPPEERAALREEIAETHLAERDLEGAARQYAAAHDAHRESPDAWALLARSAELWTAAEAPGKARAAWRKLMKEHPERSARANLGLGAIALAAGRTTAALGPFQAAARSKEADIAQTARLGLAACYERLGELDGALAELDQSALPFAVRERRKAGLRERASTRGDMGG